MLLRFKCRNLYSIREEQELSLIAAKTRAPEHDEALMDTPIKDVKALRVAAIYGANASGKSNLLLAMAYMSRMVSESWRKWEPTGKIPGWMPFLLDDESRTKPALLEVDFALNGSVYNYGFEYNEERFLKEWLIDTTRRDKVLFLREEGEHPSQIQFPGRNLSNTSQLQRVRQDLRPNSLFLSAAAQFGHEQLTPIFEWIIERFYRLQPDLGQYLSYTAEQCTSVNKLNQIRQILKAAGTGVADIKVTDENFSQHDVELRRALTDLLKSRGLPVPEYISSTMHAGIKIQFLHKGEGGKLYELPYELESAGTKAFFEMLGPILCELESGSILLIDELESSLHPHLARYLVKMFNDPLLNPRGAQLIYVSHNPVLLDDDLLRRDQIWLAEKDHESVSAFHSIADFKPRKGQDLSIAYLKGRFGGIPFIDEEQWDMAIKSSLEEQLSDAPASAGV